VLRQLHHAVLHDIERRFFVPHVIDRALESASFDAFQEVGEFLFSGQARRGAGVRRVGRCVWRSRMFTAANYAFVLYTTAEANLNARKCHNPRCKSKGKRVKVRRNISPLMAMASSPGATSQGLARGTQGISFPK
jgi:hypothetical protein